MERIVFSNLIFAILAGYLISLSACAEKFKYNYTLGNITVNSTTPVYIFPTSSSKKTTTTTAEVTGVGESIPPLGPFDRIRGPDCKTPFVTFDLKLICGSDGKTYDNVSIFRNAQCDNENLEFQHWGRCKGTLSSVKGREQLISKRPYLPQGIVPSPISTTTTTTATTTTTTTTTTTVVAIVDFQEGSPLGPFDRIRGPDCKTPFVTADYRPICGSDGKTYSNVALFRNAQCDDENLDFVHWGECPTEVKPEESTERPPLGPFDRVRGPNCKTPFVTLDLDPICGSDGKTYDNTSIFRNAQCDDENLNFAYWGECTTEVKPEESTERPPLGPFDRVRGPNCKTPFVTLDLDPICGSDGKTYDNTSIFRNAQCDDKNLKFAYWGECTTEVKPEEPIERPPLGPFNRIRGPDCVTPYVTYELNLICGSDGKTYSNISSFRNGQCEDENLEFKRWGECTSEESQPNKKKREDLGTLDRPRGPKCKQDCPKFYDPICSSTGTIYANECYFRNAQCDDEKLGFLHWGVCNSNDADKINGIIFIEESGPFELEPLGPFDRVRGPDCKTVFVDFKYYPICGTNGKTYENVSHFRNAQCDDENLEFRYWGVCFEGYEEYFGNMIPLGPFDRVRGPGCKTPCTKEYNPVCGTNRVTYSNPCEFRNAQCDDVNLEFLHWGKCSKSICNKPAQPSAQPSQAPVVVERRTFNAEEAREPLGPFDRVRGPECRTPCTREFDPVCGTDGITYPNPCEFRNAQCDNSNLEFAYFGECSDESEQHKDLSPVGELNSEFYKYNYDLYRIRGPNCKKPCSSLDSPVYGSDGKEYKNICYLLNAMCDDSTLEHYMARVYNSEEDKKNPPKVIKADLGPFDRKRGPNCKQECSKYYNPVCSSTGTVYANDCYFRNAQCDDEKLKFLHWGVCDSNDADKITAIIFTKDSGPFETLPLGPFDRVRGPDCVTPFVTMDYRPICGSDGKTYTNISHFRNSQCEDSNLEFVHWGKCLTTEENVESPDVTVGGRGLPGPLDRERGPNCKTPCTREYHPICGNDGVTYANPCTFKNAQCDNEGLTALHFGRCNDGDVHLITTTKTKTPGTACSTKPTTSEMARGHLRSVKGTNEEEDGSLPTSTTTKTISESYPKSDEKDEKEEHFMSLMEVLSKTSFNTPEPTITRESTGNCLNPTDLEILFGETSVFFQNLVIVCGRSSLGNGGKTAKCIQSRSFGPNELRISDQCVSCYKESATCGGKKCKSACLTSTCNTKCQKCFEKNCASSLKVCVGTSWLPRPCGLDPFGEIPEGWKVPDPKQSDVAPAK
ncbi:T13C2.5 [Cryptosporidium hominis TU502]|nr:T13C2.5 [Cryptosporidium hominis TU502]